MKVPCHTVRVVDNTVAVYIPVVSLTNVYRHVQYQQCSQRYNSRNNVWLEMNLVALLNQLLQLYH